MQYISFHDFKVFRKISAATTRISNKDIFGKPGIEREEINFHCLALDFVMTVHRQGEGILSLNRIALVQIPSVC